MFTDYIILLFLFLFKDPILIFWPCHMACVILVPLPGIEPAALALEVESLNHWTAWEVPNNYIMMHLISIQ